MDSTRLLQILLRCWGSLDLLALIAVMAPTHWLAWGHEWAGLGEFPDAPLVPYLARSASALYAFHGALILFLSTNVRRYGPVISFLAVGGLVHSLIIVSIDWMVGMPSWWTRIEGGAFALGSIAILLLRHGPLAQIGASSNVARSSDAQPRML
jgi:hypothetical protein